MNPIEDLHTARRCMPSKQVRGVRIPVLLLLFSLLAHIATAARPLPTVLPVDSISAVLADGIKGLEAPYLRNALATAAPNIKDGLQHESLKNVLAEVKNLKDGKIGAIIARFSGADPRWVWKVKEGRLSAYTNAITEPTREGVVTTLNFNELRDATKLSVARTIIHEMIHAYLVLYFKYDDNARKDYPGIVEAYRAVVPTPDLNEIHHHEMAASFVADIALALREYGRKLGLEVDDSVYTDLAWGGLDFHNSDHLAEENKIRIQRRLDAEQFDTRFFSTYPVGPQMGD